MLPPRVILAATDFSEPSRLALQAAAAMARSGAALHIVHAEDPLLDAAARQTGVDLAERTLHELQGFVRLALPHETPAPRLHVMAGEAVDVVLDAARRVDADLIVMGSHGRTGVSRVVFGSIAEGVLRHANRPVLVIPTREP